MEKILKAFGYVRKEELDEVKGELFASQCREETLRYKAKHLPVAKNNFLMEKNRVLEKENEGLKRQLAEKEAQYADAVSRWAGLARLWQEEHGGGLVYVKETADGGVQVWDEAVGEDCEPLAVIELKPIEKVVADCAYVTNEERKAEENENVALEAAAVSAGCAAEGTETGADCDPPELAGQGNAGASAGEQGDGIPKG